MDETGGIKIPCSSCGKKISEGDIYTYEGKHMCDNYAMKSGLFPLEHTGARRDKISEKGRLLNIPSH